MYIHTYILFFHQGKKFESSISISTYYHQIPLHIRMDGYYFDVGSPLHFEFAVFHIRDHRCEISKALNSEAVFTYKALFFTCRTNHPIFFFFFFQLVKEELRSLSYNFNRYLYRSDNWKFILRLFSSRN